MKVTLKLLERLNACSGGIEFYKSIGCPGSIDECKKMAIKHNEYGYMNWLITHKLKRIDLAKYAVYAAKQVQKYYTDRYPEDNRVGEAIKATEKYIKNPNKENANAAAYAAHAAHAAARAAHAAYAAYAAADAAAHAADVAADVADAAYAAAYAANAAADVAYAADVKMIKSKILSYGVNLIKEMEQNKCENSTMPK